MRAMMALVLHLGGVGKCVRLIWEWSVHNQESGDLQVLLDAIDKDGAILPEGIEGDQIREVVEVMDGPVSKVLQSHPTSSI
jgi:hypothetical protein